MYMKPLRHSLCPSVLEVITSMMKQYLIHGNTEFLILVLLFVKTGGSIFKLSQQGLETLSVWTEYLYTYISKSWGAAIFPGADCHQSSTIPPWRMCVTIQGLSVPSEVDSTIFEKGGGGI